MATQAGQPQGAGGPHGTSGPGVPEPEGRKLGLPYDWRKPTMARTRSRWWNPDDRRLFTPKAYGWGYDLNFYWLRHPARYLAHGS